jgi:hypothetical protein
MCLVYLPQDPYDLDSVKIFACNKYHEKIDHLMSNTGMVALSHRTETMKNVG